MKTNILLILTGVLLGMACSSYSGGSKVERKAKDYPELQDEFTFYKICKDGSALCKKRCEKFGVADRNECKKPLPDKVLSFPDAQTKNFICMSKGKFIEVAF